MKADGAEADGAPNGKGAAAATKPVGGNEPNGDDDAAPNAGVEDGVALNPENGADVVLGAPAPKDPKVGAATVEGVVCWEVAKLNCILGASEGVVTGVATFEAPKANDDGTDVIEAPNPNPTLLAGLVASLGNWYAGGAGDPKLMNDAVVVCGVPNEKDIDGAAAVDVLVVGVAEPKVKAELELAGTADPTVDFVVVVGKLKLGGAAAIPNAVGAAAVAVCEPKVGRDVVEVDRPNAIDDAVVVGNPKVVGAGAEVVMPKGGLVDVATVVEAPKVGADETEAPNTVGPPKLKGGAVAGLNSDREGVDVATPVKLNGADVVVVVVGIDDELLGICDSFSVATPKFKVGFSVDVSGLPNANVDFVCSVFPKENGGAELTGACLMSDGATGFLPRISITLPVSSKDTFDSGTACATKLKMGLDLEPDDVVVGATLNAA